MELRPSLRRVYGAVKDFATFDPIFTPFGLTLLHSSRAWEVLSQVELASSLKYSQNYTRRLTHGIEC